MMEQNNNIPVEAQRQIDHITEICAERKPPVVITSITFNHGPYLHDTLDGFVMQQTDFPFVAIVHDDASTDKTADVLREYAEKYPDIILPIYETENQYSKRDGSLSRIIRAAREATGAKYVALCEGDDYWTDPLKLQKQVTFLESHLDFTMCFHNAIVHYEDGRKPDHLMSELKEREYDVTEVAKFFIVPTASMVFRHSVYKSNYFCEYEKSRKFIFGDNPLIRCCGMEGGIYGFAETMSVYRIQSTGVLSNLNDKTYYKWSLMEEEYIRIFGERFKTISHERMVEHTKVSLRLILNGNIKEGFGIIFIAIKHAPMMTLKTMGKHILNRLQKILKKKS